MNGENTKVPKDGGTENCVVALPWDSSHFGFQIGRTIWNGAAGQLRPVLEKAKSDGYRLLYIDAPRGSDVGRESAGIASRVLETGRVELTKRLCLPLERTPPSVTIRHLDKSFRDVSAIRRLGVIAGAHSRFFRDHRIDRRKAHALFEEWAEKSLHGVLADATFGGFSGGDRLVAFVTLRMESAAVRITLLSVMPEYQGQGYGTALMRQAERWAVERGIHSLVVATPAENQGGVDFYQRFGYTPSAESTVAHVWLE